MFEIFFWWYFFKYIYLIRYIYWKIKILLCNRSLINNVARRVDLCMASYEDDLKEKRKRLRNSFIFFHSKFAIFSKITTKTLFKLLWVFIITQETMSLIWIVYKIKHFFCCGCYCLTDKKWMLISETKKFGWKKYITKYCNISRLFFMLWSVSTKKRDESFKLYI